MGRLFQWIVCMGLGAAVAAGALLFDQRRTELRQEETALTIARQTLAQIEGYAYIARENEEKDPIGSAIHLFSQGNEPKLVTVARYEGEYASREKHLFDAATRTLEYRKVLTPETGDGIQLQVKLPWSGFLGARNPFENDVALGATGGLSFFTLLFFTSAFSGKRRRELRQTRARIQSWTTVLRNILTEFSLHLRELIRCAQKMAKAAGKSHQAVASLRERIAGGIEELHASRKSVSETEQTLAQAEAASLSATMEAARLGPDAQRLAAITADVHKKIQKLRKAMQESAATIGKLEVSLEPCATDADIAFHAFDDFVSVTTEMRVYIKKSTETIGSQSRLIATLSDEFMDPKEKARAARQAKHAALAPLTSIPAPLDAPAAGATAEARKKKSKKERTAPSAAA